MGTSSRLHGKDIFVSSQAACKVENWRKAELVAVTKSIEPGVRCRPIRNLLHDQRHASQCVCHCPTALIRIEPAQAPRPVSWIAWLSLCKCVYSSANVCAAQTRPVKRIPQCNLRLVLNAPMSPADEATEDMVPHSLQGADAMQCRHAVPHLCFVVLHAFT